MEIWKDISLQLPTAPGWAGTGNANLPGLAREHQCPPQEEPAFPPALGSSRGLVLGVWRNCSFGGSLGHSLQGSQEDTKGEQGRISREPPATPVAKRNQEGLSYMKWGGSCHA